MRRVEGHTFFVLAVMAAASLSLLACPASLDDECADGACDPAARSDGSTDGGQDGDVVDPCSAHPDDAACMDESEALFVSGAGDDGAAGTREAPLKTIAAALGKVTDSKRRIYICEGKYEANIEIKTPVSLFGGFSCSWAASSTKAQLVPAKGVALRVTKVDGPVLVQDFEIVGSADDAVPGDSAVAAFVSESTNVKFSNASLTAGAGVAGAKGASRSNYNGDTAQAGGDAFATTGGAGPTCECLDKTTSSTGGKGADGMGVPSKGSAMPPVGLGNAGASSADTCDPGKEGANGVANAGGVAATVPGGLSAAGWGPAPVVPNASNGNPGQGGGGGGAKADFSTPGGGGACGGCGGGGGEAGRSGGSSFAVLSFQSTVTINGGSLRSGAGGHGGDGGPGQAGQAPGAGGKSGGCKGGTGGAGAGGSGGGGGAGGHSARVGYVGSKPNVIGAELKPGTNGLGGSGGSEGSGGTGGAQPGNAGAPGKPGPDGKEQDSLAL